MEKQPLELPPNLTPESTSELAPPLLEPYCTKWCKAYEQLKDQLEKQLEYYEELFPKGGMGKRDHNYISHNGEKVPTKKMSEYLRGGIISTMAMFESFLVNIQKEAFNMIVYDCKCDSDGIKECPRHNFDKEHDGEKLREELEISRNVFYNGVHPCKSKVASNPSLHILSRSIGKIFQMRNKDLGDYIFGCEDEPIIPMNYYYWYTNDSYSKVTINDKATLCAIMRLWYGLRCICAHGNAAPILAGGSLAKFPGCKTCDNIKEDNVVENEVQNIVQTATREDEVPNKVQTATREDEVPNKVQTTTREDEVPNKVQTTTREDEVPNKVQTATREDKAFQTTTHEDKAFQTATCEDKAVQTTTPTPVDVLYHSIYLFNQFGKFLGDLSYSDNPTTDSDKLFLKIRKNPHCILSTDLEDSVRHLPISSKDTTASGKDTTASGKDIIASGKEKIKSIAEELKNRLEAFETTQNIVRHLRYWENDRKPDGSGIYEYDGNYGLYHMAFMFGTIKKRKRGMYITPKMIPRINQFVLLLAFRIKLALAKMISEASKLNKHKNMWGLRHLQDDVKKLEEEHKTTMVNLIAKHNRTCCCCCGNNA